MWALGCLIYELATLKPPFLADSFPALKKVIIAGRFPPLPGKYSDALTRVVSSMLRLTPRQRPTAEMLLRSSEVSQKLHLDASSGNGQTNSVPSQTPNLIETIKVPQNLRKLCSALPKPCYKDARPNSPGAWTADEQRHSRHELMAADMLRKIDGKGKIPDTINENEEVTSSSAAPPLSRVKSDSNKEPGPPQPQTSGAAYRQPLRQVQSSYVPEEINSAKYAVKPVGKAVQNGTPYLPAPVEYNANRLQPVILARPTPAAAIAAAEKVISSRKQQHRIW